jgi:DNA replication and repair protein RecF
MFLASLDLKDFRIFKDKNLEFSQNTTLILGPNAIGKTNVLEAIYFLAAGKSFRAVKESEAIKSGLELTRITGIVSDENEEQLEIILTQGEVRGKKTAKKLFKVNKVGKRWKDFIVSFTAVLFRPEDIDLILGTPSLRRNYLDMVLTQVDWRYRVSLITYKKGLRQRNKLLSKIKEGVAQRFQLRFWDQLLIKNGSFITEKRQKLLEFYNQYLSSCQDLYKDKIKVVLDYDKSIISQERLDKYSQAELGAGVTLVGPHRDDIKFFVRPCSLKHKPRFSQNRNLALYGSRGEQRMAVFALKLAEVEFILKELGYRPALLLDDIFSELDKIHRDHIVNIIPKQQTIITATDISMIDKSLHDKMETIKL